MDKILYGSSSSIDMAIVRKYNKLPWNKRELSNNPGIRMSDILDLELPNAIDEWYMYSIISTVTLEDVIKYNTYPWDRSRLSTLKNFNISMLNIPMPNATGAWDWHYISQHASIEYIHNNKDLPWHWHWISERASIEDVLNHRDLPWDRRGFSFGKNGVDLYHMNLDLPNVDDRCNWSHTMLSRSRTIDLLRKYPNYQWNRSQISTYSHDNFHIDMLTIDLPNAIGEWDWDWNRISENVSMDIIIENPHLPWNSFCVLLSKHYNVRVFNAIQCDNYTMHYLCNCVTLDDIKSNPLISWNRKYLSGNYSLDRSVKDLDLPNAVDDWPEDHDTYIKLEYKSAHLFDEKKCEEWTKWLSSLSGPLSRKLFRCHMIGNITQEEVNYVLEHPDLPWNRDILTIGGRLVYQLLDANLPNAIGEWKWNQLSSNIPIDYIALHPMLPWDRTKISERSDIQLCLLDIPMPYATGEWNKNRILSNISIYEIMKYPDVIIKFCTVDKININRCLPEDIILLLFKRIQPSKSYVNCAKTLADIEFIH